ncbi:MAG: hypothetical protein ACP5QT_05485 [Brevinematia bacterium]
MPLKQIPKAKKEAYNAIVKDLKEQVDAIQKKAQQLERESLRSRDLNSNYKKIVSAIMYLDTVQIYCKMNEYSVQIMDIKNDLYLSTSRKNIYQAIKLLESIFGNVVDSALTDNEEIIKQFTYITPKRLLHLLKKFEYCIALVEYAEGESSKWKWTFVELYGKLGVLGKNMINFKEYVNKMYDPTAQYYEEINQIIMFEKNILESAAQKYRTKYELSTRDLGDMNKGIDLLNLLVRIYIILNEQEKAQETKKTIEKWKEKLELDIKKKEEDVKKAKLAGMQKKR